MIHEVSHVHCFFLKLVFISFSFSYTLDDNVSFHLRMKTKQTYQNIVFVIFIYMKVV